MILDPEYLEDLRTLELNPKPNEKQAPRFRLLSIADIEKIPPPTFLVDRVLPEMASCELHGPPGGGKTFLALDIALSIASGINFFGHPVKQGHVVYVLGEGQSGLGVRIRAWKSARSFYGAPKFSLVPEAVQLLAPHDVNLFVEALGPLPESPRLIVLDTLARCFLGGEENSARDMGMAVATIDMLRRRTKATILLVHHTRKEGDTERGSVALRGGMDTMLSLRGDDGRMKLVCEKQKDAREFPDIDLQLVKSGDSMVFRLPGQSLGPSRTALSILDVLVESFPGNGATNTEWMGAVGGAERSFWRAKGELVKAGFVAEKKEGNAKRFSATPDGKIALVLAAKNDAEENASTGDHCHDCQATANGDLAVASGSPNAGGLGGNPPLGGFPPPQGTHSTPTRSSEKEAVQELLPTLPESSAEYLAAISRDAGDLLDEIEERSAIRSEPELEEDGDGG